jgi:hypothetical protein
LDKQIIGIGQALPLRRVTKWNLRSGIVGLVLMVGGCGHNWAPGPGRTLADIEPAKGRCSLMARHGRGEFSASGSAKFVAAAVLVQGIGEAVRTQQDLDDCMLASGFLIADGGAAGPNPVPPGAMTTGSAEQDGPPPDRVAPALVAGTTAISTPQPIQPINDARAERAARAQRVAEAWVVAQGILSRPGYDQQKYELNLALCSAGDRSACFMAEALAQTTR